MSTLGERGFENETSLLKSVHFEVIDRIICEMRNRFDHNNNILLAIAAANDIDQDDFDRDKLLPLASLGLTVPSQSEISVAKAFLAKEKLNPENQSSNTLKILFSVKNAFPETYRLLEAIDTFGSSTSVCECAFSAVARIDTVRRMSMTNQRMCDLSFLAFEKKRLSSLDEDVILRKFATNNRKIQLY